MLLSLQHKTTFVYKGEAKDSVNDLRLCPTSDTHQQCRSFKLTITPTASPLEYEDFNGNIVHSFNITQSHPRLIIHAESEVETVPNYERKNVPEASFKELKDSPDAYQFAEFLTPSSYIAFDDSLKAEAEKLVNLTRSDVWSEAKKIGTHIFKTFKYSPGTTSVKTTAQDALNLRSGVCQDFAHVMIGLCRLHGIPARYVSGYFFNITRRHGEIEASHAWVEVYIPNLGWTGFDPTHDRDVDERYIKVATGKDYADIIPVSGTYRGGVTEKLDVEVNVREISRTYIPT